MATQSEGNMSRSRGFLAAWSGVEFVRFVGPMGTVNFKGHWKNTKHRIYFFFLPTSLFFPIFVTNKMKANSHYIFILI